jgi:ubiquinone/menaquinone biosynthesis C-methylase UbiE
VFGDTELARATENCDRLRVMSRVAHASSCALFERVGVRPGMHCLDLGCGTGEAARELARRVGRAGRVVAVDRDDGALELARREGGELPQIEWRAADVRELSGPPEFDVVYARFVLSELSDPAGALAGWRSLLRPGGALVIEDIDASRSFCYPPESAFERYQKLRTAISRARGVDPTIGPRLFTLLTAARFSSLHIDLTQRAAAAGDVKLLAPLTLQWIAPLAIDQGHADPEEIERLLVALRAIANDRQRVMGAEAVFQVWGRALTH